MEAILPHWDVLVVQIITFALGMGAIWALYLKPLGAHLRQRREGIAKDLASADSARGEAEKLRAELVAERARLADDSRRMRDEARKDAARLRDELLERARTEQKSMLDATRAQLEQEKEQALREIREEVAGLVVQVAGKLIGQKLDSKSDQALAEKLVQAVKVSRN